MMRHAADRLLMVSLSHRQASLDLLERVVVRRDDVGDTLRALREAGYGEAVVLSTCSRTEIYALAGADGADDLVELLGRRAGAWAPAVAGAAQVLSGERAVAHLFLVTAGF